MAGEGTRRITELPGATSVESGDYFAIDSADNGTKKLAGRALPARDEISSAVVDYLPFTLVANSYINKTTGAFVNYTGWSRTDYIEIDSAKTIWVDSAAQTTYNACYDANKTFVRAFSLAPGLNRVDVPSNAKYIAISGGPSIFPIRVFNKRSVPAQNKLDSVISATSPFGIMPLEGWTIGGIDTSGNLILNWQRLSSDYIPIDGNTTIQFHHTNSTYFLLVTEYDETKAFVRQRANYDLNDFLWATLPNTRYIRLSVGRVDNHNMTPSESVELGITANISTSSRLKVMTYNMGHYNYGVGVGLPPDIYDEKLLNYRRFFGEQNCDVIGIQEYDTKMDEANTINSADVLWNHSYPSSVFTGSSTALRSRIRIFDGKYSQLSTGRYYCEGTMNSIYLLSVHLSVGVSNTQTRLDEADEIISTLLAGKERFIMFGDFNPEPGEEEALYKKFTDAGYNIANCGWFGKYYTWSNNRADFDNYENPTGTRLYYLDNIITSANIKIENVYPVPSAYKKLSSDHIPLVAELDIK